MSNKRLNHSKKSAAYSRDQKRVDKEYYESLYNDLPKDVVNILMDTHPLMGQNNQDPEATAYRTRKPEQSEVEAVRASRMQQVSQEIATEMQTPPKEEDTMPRNRRNDESNPSGYHFDDSGDYNDHSQMGNDKMQFVQMNVSQRQAVEPQDSLPRKKKKKQQEQLNFGEDDVENRRYNFEDFDWDAKEKEDNLNQLYDDDYEDKERMPLPGKKVVIAGVIAVVLLGVCGFSILSLKNKLAKAEQQIQEQTDLSAKYQEVQMQKLNLEEEIRILRGEQPTATGEDGGESNVEGGEVVPAENGEYEIYTATESDTYWSMAAQFYGNGMEYQKILDANGLTEADAVRPGQKYKIPKKE